MRVHYESHAVNVKFNVSLLRATGAGVTGPSNHGFGIANQVFFTILIYLFMLRFKELLKININILKVFGILTVGNNII